MNSKPTQPARGYLKNGKTSLAGFTLIELLVVKPATYHNKAGGLAFGDGHSEIKKWRDSAMSSYKGVPTGDIAPSIPNPGDLAWLEERGTVTQ